MSDPFIPHNSIIELCNLTLKLLTSYWIDCISHPAVQNSLVAKLTLILLTCRIWWAPNNASRWQMGFNWTFKGLRFCFVTRVTPRLAIFQSSWYSYPDLRNTVVKGSLLYRVIHKSVKDFKNSQQIDYATDNSNSYVDRERNCCSFF